MNVGYYGNMCDIIRNGVYQSVKQADSAQKLVVNKSRFHFSSQEFELFLPTHPASGHQLLNLAFLKIKVKSLVHPLAVYRSEDLKNSLENTNMSVLDFSHSHLY